MMSTKRIVEVATEKASLAPERIEGYHADLVRCLTEVIQTQQTGLSDKGRRAQVAKILEGLGAKVAASGGS
jgi:hypothetical protein